MGNPFDPLYADYTDDELDGALGHFWFSLIRLGRSTQPPDEMTDACAAQLWQRIDSAQREVDRRAFERAV